ncbi:UDP-glucose--hexose-1-phosphate uridylyltransferase [Neobacillus sp. PS3-34]|uniref:UDP-glucose--hexose-1-phosphate uridylyltransferase n=1 Tax=Neobacillus sp. PS3-34 TaxID=3070678 RepID=UPI0027E114F6|nr:UDP-glucose--hexose-1-phosphate uridylyltransferase [Neobacillus sp. PS3-34]WML48303.1 UDP-glucose--hexose-1-phosphate uridylyltransferase [Neobacillus sp. PS3-34]
MLKIHQEIQHLLKYGLMKKLFEAEDEVYVRNRILAILCLLDWQEAKPENPIPDLSEILNRILNWAYENGVLLSNTTTERDVLDTEIMNCMLPRPSEVIRKFKQHYKESPEKATTRFYELAVSSNYVRADRITKNIQWKTATPYGEFDITINLAKPEKDPKEIALIKSNAVSSYPKCLLCHDNEGYKGTLSLPARGNHRIIPISLSGEDWFLQYSPYVYYHEHCIVFSKEHVPMKICSKTFKRLLDFTEQFPHYFIGSNADLPIVGGSILTHDHFQGGRYSFAMEKAEVVDSVILNRFPSIKIGILNWPLSVIRIQGEKDDVGKAAEFIWRAWKEYSDAAVDVFPYSERTPHNTVTPIARRRGDLFEMDIVLRNNRTSGEFPDGIFHPHKQHHHIKKENIGLIEVMGLAVLPGRLTKELDQISEYLLSPVKREKWNPDLLKHWEWYQELQQKKYSNITRESVKKLIKREVGLKFQQVLENAGVFKQNEEGRRAFHEFFQFVKASLID